jgi:lysophospholipase L1-like esterase
MRVSRVGRRIAAAAAIAVFASAAPAATAAPLPVAMAALGDSISRGFDACGFYFDCTHRSWATGDDDQVGSHRSRLVAAGDKSLVSTNVAQTGALVGQLADQADAAVAAGASYVTIEIGANDACRPSAAEMTAVADFGERLRSALARLHDGLPRAQVFVASIPDLMRVWEVGHSHRFAQLAWAKLHVCPSLLADPTSTGSADVERRKSVHDRVEAYNVELAKACTDYGDQCRYDGGAVFATRFTSHDLSKWDWFHPNVFGQHLLAEATWGAGFFRATS